MNKQPPSNNVPNSDKFSASWSMQQALELSEAAFVDWRKLLEERTGIYLLPQQKTFLQSQLAIRLRELGNISPEAYFEQLTHGVDSVIEWSILTDRLVVKETSFFRHPPSYQFLRGYVQDRIQAGLVNDSFDVLSVGCSTGEECYSLAMLLDDSFTRAGIRSYWGVTGMDISSPALSFARAAVYPARKINMVPAAFRERYFTMQDNLRGRVQPNLKEKVCFTQGNVIELKKMPLVKMDIISCNNMLIYFRRWRRRKILNNLAERLKTGGILLIGLGEIVDWEHPNLVPVRDDTVQAYVCVK